MLDSSVDTIFNVVVFSLVQRFRRNPSTFASSCCVTLYFLNNNTSFMTITINRLTSELSTHQANCPVTRLHYELYDTELCPDCEKNNEDEDKEDKLRKDARGRRVLLGVVMTRGRGKNNSRFDRSIRSQENVMLFANFRFHVFFPSHHFCLYLQDLEKWARIVNSIDKTP